MNIYTIGFTKKSARYFFGILIQSNIKRLIDVRLKNNSQLAGFAKKYDLAFFLKQICDADYIHLNILSPTPELLTGIRNGTISWNEYESRFNLLMDERQIDTRIDRKLFDVPAVLLCSEPTPEKCHRRLVAEYLSRKWGSVGIIHL